MFCTKCGTQISDTSRFCSACGRTTEPADQEAAGATAGAYSSAGTTAAPRRLRRVVREKKIAGVCAGFAEYFDTDITLMRLIWVVLLLVPPGIGLPAYLISWMVLPKD